VVGIDRISWLQIQKPDPIIYGGDDGIATGIAQYNGRLITILDFEKIIAEISPATGIQTSDIDRLGPRKPQEDNIIIAEDSMLLSKMIVESLHKAGYTKTMKFNNGEETWEYLSGLREKEGSVLNHVSCLISDIEMPRMDGHRLTKLVKSDPVLKEIPVILFSSLINEEMRIKGRELGADDQISKPEIANLVTIVDRLTGKK
jgi:two-component system chemotaxis response regulator CheV